MALWEPYTQYPSLTGMLFTCCFLPCYCDASSLCSCESTSLVLLWCLWTGRWHDECDMSRQLHLGTFTSRSTHRLTDTAPAKTYNSRGQSPCEVAALIGGSCLVNTNKSASFVISRCPATHSATALVINGLHNETSQYGRLSQNITTPCVCSMVFGNLLSACQYCQGFGLPKCVTLSF